MLLFIITKKVCFALEMVTDEVCEDLFNLDKMFHFMKRFNVEQGHTDRRRVAQGRLAL